MDQHEERLAVAALFAQQLAIARHIIATTEARIAASDAVIDQMAQALIRRAPQTEWRRHRFVPPQWDGPGYFVPPKLADVLSHGEQ